MWYKSVVEAGDGSSSRHSINAGAAGSGRPRSESSVRLLRSLLAKILTTLTIFILSVVLIVYGANDCKFFAGIGRGWEPPDMATPPVLLASCSDVVKTFEVDKQGVVNHCLDIGLPQAEGNAPPVWHCVRWNHNNQVMACGGEEGRIALVHESGKVLEVLQEMAPHDEGVASTQPVLSLAWGARSRFLVTSGVSSCPTLWDLKRKGRLRSFRGHRSHPVTCVAFSNDEAHVASGNQRGHILLHQLRSDEPVSVLTPTDRSSSPVHPTATGAANRCVRYWSMRQNYLLSGYEDGVVRTWDVNTGDTVAAFKGQHQGSVHAVCGSTVNNKLIASGGADRRLILFDVNQHKLLKECRTTSVIVDMCFHPDGDMIAAGCSNGDVLLYDLRRAAVPCITVKAHHPLPVRSISLHNPRRDKAPSSTTKPSAPSSSSVSSSSSSVSTTPSALRSSALPSHDPVAKTPTPSGLRAGVTAGVTAGPTARNALAAEVLARPPSPARSLSSLSSNQSSSLQPPSPAPARGLIRPSAVVAKPQTTTSSLPKDNKTDAKAPVSKETLPKPPGGNSFHESSFRFKGPVSERKDDDTKEPKTAPPKAPSLEASEGLKQWAEDMATDLRESVKRDMQGMHLDMLAQFDTMQQAMQLLCSRMGDLVSENASLRQELQDLQRAYAL